MSGAKKPKQYLDDARIEVNPEWMEWAKERTYERAPRLGMPAEWFFPEDYGKAIPDEGAWIRVIEVPHTALDWDVPPQSIWKARRHTSNMKVAIDFFGRARNPIYSPYRAQQAVIITPGGDLHLWPHEYEVVADITAYVGAEPDCMMHELGGDPVLAADDDRLFYLMSRGITRKDAAVMLLPDIATQDFVYFTLSDELVEALDGVGVPLWRHIQLHPRTKKEAV